MMFSQSNQKIILFIWLNFTFFLSLLIQTLVAVSKFFLPDSLLIHLCFCQANTGNVMYTDVEVSLMRNLSLLLFLLFLLVSDNAVISRDGFLPLSFTPSFF